MCENSFPAPVLLSVLQMQRRGVVRPVVAQQQASLLGEQTARSPSVVIPLLQPVICQSTHTW